MSDYSKDHFVNNVTNQRGYSQSFSMPDQFFPICTFMNSISVYFECFDFFSSFSDLHSDCVDIVSSTYISMCIPHSVSHMRGGIMLWRPDICQNVIIDIGKTMIKMYSWDDIAWFIIFLILYVYFISQVHDGYD